MLNIKKEIINKKTIQKLIDIDIDFTLNFNCFLEIKPNF